MPPATTTNTISASIPPNTFRVLIVGCLLSPSSAMPPVRRADVPELTVLLVDR